VVQSRNYPVRAALLALREQAAAAVTALEREFADVAEAASAAGADDEHDPEGATLGYERQHAAALLARARDQLAEVDAALHRLAAGSYGRCASCGRPIAAERLAARPTAIACIACASARQR
jgi:DnaK suppressor protein